VITLRRTKIVPIFWATLYIGWLSHPNSEVIFICYYGPHNGNFVTIVRGLLADRMTLTNRRTDIQTDIITIANIRLHKICLLKNVIGLGFTKIPRPICEQLRYSEICRTLARSSAVVFQDRENEEETEETDENFLVSEEVQFANLERSFREVSFQFH